MSQSQPRRAVPPPASPFQFSLRTLLLLFVVAASSLGVFGAWGLLVFASVVALAAYPNAAAKPRSCLEYLVLFWLCVACLIGMLQPAVEYSPAPGCAGQCSNNLQQIASALLEYHKANGHFPPAYLADQEGKPMTSWRMLLLPYLGRGDLYRAYNSRQAWNSPANKKVSSARVDVYECPSHYGSHQPGMADTDYFAVVGPNSAWTGDKPRNASDFGSDASHTIMLVEVADSGVAWAEPRDFSVDALGIVGRDPHGPALSSNHRPPDSFWLYGHLSGACVAMADGNVHFLRTDNLSPEEFRKILQNGGWSGEGILSEDGLPAARRLNWPNIAALAVWLLSVGTLLTAAERSRKVRMIPPSASATAV